MLLGVLHSEMHALSLYDPSPAKPFLGHSVMETANSMRGIKTPVWYERDCGVYKDHSVKCNIAKLMDWKIDDIVDMVDVRRGIARGLED